ncbi:MAG: polysaccharide biosynthesis tyrosine autokinase [Puniceicoccales bacterium]|jgi:capsular exopolysaccharide synthesis family protein|nr:polysaccharide biosynthesis tyrosine autokinase [Puniceicoccales bacterium]
MVSPSESGSGNASDASNTPSTSPRNPSRLFGKFGGAPSGVQPVPEIVRPPPMEDDGGESHAHRHRRREHPVSPDAHPKYNTYYSEYYGGSYGGYSEKAAVDKLHTLRDYVLILRERFWYLVLAVFVCTASALIYTMNSQDEYRAMAKLRVHRHPYAAPSVVSRTQPETDTVTANEDFLTQVELMRSIPVIERVAKRLTQHERKLVLEPFRGSVASITRDVDILGKFREILPQRQSLIASITYTHPEREIAQRMTQYFAEEIRNYNKDLLQNQQRPLIVATQGTLAALDQQIEKLYDEKDRVMRENPRLLELNSEMAIARVELSTAIQIRIADQKAHAEIEALWNKINELRQKNIPPETLPQIANAERVASLEAQVVNRRINCTELLKRYTEQHPHVIVAKHGLEEATREHQRAISDTIAKVEQNHAIAKTSLDATEARIANLEKAIALLHEQQGGLNAINRKIEDQERLRSTIAVGQQSELSKLADGRTHSVDIIEPAMLLSNAPINKNYFRNGALGFGSGFLIGCVIIFFLAYWDDRVKSAADVEDALNLPLIGVLPVAPRFDTCEKARLVATGGDRMITEAFRTIYSALQISPSARATRIFLVTSTTPDEGKTFAVTNLAITYAQHGEKVLVIDADLRLPSVDKTLRLEGGRGITRYLLGQNTLDESLYRDVVPNLDVLPVGESIKNPTQVICSQQFMDMFDALKDRYDRIFLDTPPLGAVSDVLNLLPYAEGILFIVRFNSVSRRFIKLNINRFRESKVRIHGAILNQIKVQEIPYYTDAKGVSYASKYYNEDEGAASKEVPVTPQQHPPPPPVYASG